MKRVFEVDIMRPIAIILVVLTHCFAVYTGAWRSPSDYNFPYIKNFEVFTDLLLAFRMPVVVLIAGYILAYQFEVRNNLGKFKDFTIKKVNRLLLPCYIFSILYIFLFKEINIYNFTILLFSGAGHLWFLTMLFWNFILGFLLLNYLKEAKTYLYLILLLLPFSTVSFFLPNFFGLSKFIGYSVFFVFGIYLWYLRPYLVKRLSIVSINVLFVVFTMFFYILLFLKYNYLDLSVLSDKIILASAQIIISFFGVFLFYTFVLYLVEVRHFVSTKYFNMLSRKSYGIYVFHQFILMFIIYKLKISDVVSDLYMPLFYFLVTFTSSLVLTNLFLKTKIGKFLIG